MENGELSEALAASIQKQRGDLGFLLRVLKERPRAFNPHVLKGLALFKNPSNLDQRVAELVAIGAATALRCDHCLDAHIDRALEGGATLAEVMDAILVAGAISESSALSVAFRKFRQKEGKLKKGQ